LRLVFVTLSVLIKTEVALRDLHACQHTLEHKNKFVGEPFNILADVGGIGRNDLGNPHALGAWRLGFRRAVLQLCNFLAAIAQRFRVKTASQTF
jgi:hypothetical protein